MIQVDSMLLADAATVADGKFYIHGAAWDNIVTVAFPVVQPALTIPVLLRVPWNDANNVAQMLEVDVVDADGASILPTPPGPLRGPITVGRPPQIAPGDDLLIPLVFTLAGIRFEQPGTYVITMRVDGVETKRYPFHLRYHPQIQPPSVFRTVNGEGRE